MAGGKVAGGNCGSRTGNCKCCWRNLREQKNYSQMLLEESEGTEKKFVHVAAGI